MPTVPKERSNGNNPFSKPFSSEMQDHFVTSLTLYEQWNKISTLGSIALYPKTSTTTFLVNTDAHIERLERTKPQDRIDGILITEMKERAEIMRVQLELPTQKAFDYDKVLRCFGVSPSDIKQLEDRFRAVDYNEAAEKMLSINGDSYGAKPENTEQEIGTMKTVYQKLLRASFDSASTKSKETFPDFGSYSQSVQFVNNCEGHSYQNTGKVYYNFYDTDMINVKEGLRYHRVVDIFNAADLIGEEGLLGHQGQFLVSEKSDIPHFLKVNFNTATTINAEIMGNIGSSRMTKLLVSNPDMIEGIANKDFEFLKRRAEIQEEHAFVSRFMRGYGSYAFFKNGRDVQRTVDAIHSIVKNPMVLSEEFANRVSFYYNSQPFWKDYRYDLNVWNYVFADSITDSIGKKLDTMSEDSAKKVLDNLQLGWWTKKGFEQYTGYLMERFSSPK